MRGRGGYELQAALPADSQLEIAVIDEKLYEGPLADLVGGGGGLYGSLHLGYPFRKVGSGNVMGRFLIEADLEYRFAPDWGLQLIGGYYLFDKDDDVTGASLQLKRYFHLTPTTWTVYAEFGPGYYKPRHIDGAFALNGGVGIVRNIAPRLDLSLGGNYFRLFTSPTEIEFWGVKAGLHFRF